MLVHDFHCKFNSYYNFSPEILSPGDEVVSEILVAQTWVIPVKVEILVFSPEHPRWDQNRWPKSAIILQIVCTPITVRRGTSLSFSYGVSPGCIIAYQALPEWHIDTRVFFSTLTEKGWRDYFTKVVLIKPLPRWRTGVLPFMDCTDTTCYRTGYVVFVVICV